MSDPRQHVRPGQPLSVAASQINWINAAMRAGGGVRGAPLEAFQPGTNLVLVKNTTGGTVGRWAVLEITGTAIDPATDARTQASFEAGPCVNGGTPTTNTNSRCCITFQPLVANAVGLALVAGVAPCKVEILSTSHRFAKPKASTAELQSADSGPIELLTFPASTGTGKWCFVRFGAAARPLRVGKYMPTGTSGPWLPDTTATVDIFENGTPPSETASSQVVTGVVNHTRKVPHGSWVLFETAANGYSYLVEAASTGATGCTAPVLGGDDVSLFAGFDATKIQLLGHTAQASGPSGPTGCISLQWYTIANCTGATGATG